MVTIGVGIYNNEKTIARVLDSIILNIDYITKIILNDNGSTDRTGEICQEYISKYPNKFKYVCHKKNRGSHFNALYFAKYPIKTKYFMLMRAAGFIPKDYIRNMLEKTKNEPEAAMFYPMFYYCRREPFHYTDRLYYIDMVATDGNAYNRIIDCLKNRNKALEWWQVLYNSLYRTDRFKEVIRDINCEIGFIKGKKAISLDISNEDTFFIRLLSKGKFVGVDNVCAYLIQRDIESPFQISRRYKKAINCTFLQHQNRRKLFDDFKINVFQKIERKPLNWENELFRSFRATYNDFYGDYRDNIVLRFIRYVESNIDFYINNASNRNNLICEQLQKSKLFFAVKNNSILKILEYNNIKAVGLYGSGYIFKRFLSELTRVDCTHYIIKSDSIDCPSDNSKDIDISKYENIRKIDAIIVAPATIFDDSKNYLKGQLKEGDNVRIVSIWEIIECAYALNKYGINVTFMD